MEVIKTVKQKVPDNIKWWRVMYDKGICCLRHQFGPINLTESSTLLVWRLACTPQEADLMSSEVKPHLSPKMSIFAEVMTQHQAHIQMMGCWTKGNNKRPEAASKKTSIQCIPWPRKRVSDFNMNFFIICGTYNRNIKPNLGSDSANELEEIGNVSC